MNSRVVPIKRVDSFLCIFYRAGNSDLDATYFHMDCTTP